MQSKLLICYCLLFVCCFVFQVLKQSLLDVAELKYIPGSSFPEEQENREGRLLLL